MHMIDDVIEKLDITDNILDFGCGWDVFLITFFLSS